MSADTAPLRARIDAHRDALGALGTTWRVLASTSSTNDEALRWAADGAPEGAWVSAAAQTAGRGRRGRTWISPPGAGIYVSIVFRPEARANPAHDSATSLLTLMAGVAVATAVRGATATPVTLEWPNDIVVEPTAGQGVAAARKLAGILAEGASSGGRLTTVVVGIGLNVRPASYPPEIAARAISLEEACGRAIDADAMLVSILAAVASWRRTLLEPNGGPAVLEAWRALAPSAVGRGVRWLDGTEPREGITAGIDATGALLVDSPAGRARLTAGEVRWA